MSDQFIAFDWGTTNLRAALINADGSIAEERNGISGVGQFCKEQFAAQFDEITKGWPSVPAIAAGMVGSRQGWEEAPYLPCPASPSDLSKAMLTFQHGSRSISIVPGLMINIVEHSDVMRGEESQLAGFLTQNPTFSGTVIMPGSHSKWVRLADGIIQDFRTYMTGELFEAISNHTILKHSVTPTDASEHAFSEKAKRITNQLGSMEGALFSLRAGQLLNNTDTGELRQELSAQLIMAELKAGQTDGFELSDEVTLIGTGSLTELYAKAVEALGKTAKQVDGTALIWPALTALAKKSNLIGASYL